MSPGPGLEKAWIVHYVAAFVGAGLVARSFGFAPEMWRFAAGFWLLWNGIERYPWRGGPR